MLVISISFASVCIEAEGQVLIFMLFLALYIYLRSLTDSLKSRETTTAAARSSEACCLLQQLLSQLSRKPYTVVVRQQQICNGLKRQRFSSKKHKTVSNVFLSSVFDIHNNFFSSFSHLFSVLQFFFSRMIFPLLFCNTKSLTYHKFFKRGIVSSLE